MRHLTLVLLLLAAVSAMAACRGSVRSEGQWAVRDIDQEVEFYEPIDGAIAPYNVRTAQGDKRVTQTPARQPAPAPAPVPAARPTTPAPYASPPPVYRTPTPPPARPVPQAYGTRALPPPPPPPPNWPGDR